MTYRGLVATLVGLTSEQLDQNVTIHVLELGEFFPVTEVLINNCAVIDEGNCILDAGHIYLEIDG